MIRTAFWFGNFVHGLGLLPDALENLHATVQLRWRNVREQFLAEIDSSSVDLFDRDLGAFTEVNRFATAIVRGGFSRDPTGSFQPMQQTDKGRFFDAEMRGNLGLGQITLGSIKMKEGPPFRLAEAEGFKSLIQLQAPGASYAVEQWAELF